MVDKATFVELLIVGIDDLDVVVELFAEVDDAFVLVVDFLVVDTICCGTPFRVGAPLTGRG